MKSRIRAGVSMAIALAFIFPIFITFLAIPNAVASPSMSDWGYLTGHSGDGAYIWMNNGDVNLTIDAGNFFITTSDGLVKMTNFRLSMENNGTAIRSDNPVTYTHVGFMHTFSDSLGGGLEYQLMYWEGGPLNVSWYWKMYDNEDFLVTYAEAKNPNSYSMNISEYLIVTPPTVSFGGVKVGSTTAQMWKWGAGLTNDLWKGQGSDAYSGDMFGIQTPVVVLTSAVSQKALTFGPLTANQGSTYIHAASDATDSEIYGLAGFEVMVDYSIPSSGFHPRTVLTSGANWTSDTMFIGISDTNELIPALADWVDCIVASNTLRTYTGGGIWDSWNVYGANINQTMIYSIINFTAIYTPEVEYIEIDDGWQLNSGTINRKDTLAMQVNTTRFPDMATLVTYAHTKGLKVALWTSLGPMGFTGAINNTHPEYRLHLVGGGYQSYTTSSTKEWYMDISRPDVLMYIQTQLESIQTTWGIDGFKVDFQYAPDTSDQAWNWNQTTARTLMNYWKTVGNATSTCGLMMSGMPLSFNVFRGWAFNNMASGLDTEDLPTLAAGFTNYYHLSMSVLQAASKGRLPVVDYDMITECYRGSGRTTEYVQTHTELTRIMGGLPQLSYRPIWNASYFSIVDDLLNDLNYTADKWISGQNGMLHSNSDVIAFARTISQPTANFNPIRLVVGVNLGAVPGQCILNMADFGFAPSSSGIIYFMQNDTLLDIPPNGSIAIPANSHILFEIVSSHLYYYPAAISSLISLIFMMVVIGVIAGIAAETARTIQRQKTRRSEEMTRELLNMVLYIIIACGLLGIIYGIFIGG